MKPLEQRVSTLEAARGSRGETSRLVLLAPRGELTPVQRDQAAAARAAGRAVLLIELLAAVAREGNA